MIIDINVFKKVMIYISNFHINILMTQNHLTKDSLSPDVNSATWMERSEGREVGKYGF